MKKNPMFKCKKCNEDVHKHTGGICQKCQIGSENPAHWVLKEVKKAILEGRDKEHNKYLKWLTAYKSIRYHVNGYYVNNTCYTHIPEKNMVIMGCSGQSDNENGFPNLQIVFHRWTHDGSVAFRKAGPYKISSINTFASETLPYFHESLVELINFTKTGDFFCSGCDKTFPKGTETGRHFAGKYCNPCWEVYKKKNYRVCLKCKCPLYECYC